MRKLITIITLLTMILFVSSSCGANKISEEELAVAQKEAETNLEIKQNDYRGGVIRTFALKDHILSIMDNMKRNNGLIRSDSPNSFWNTQGYQDFVSTFLTQSIINDTQWFNEEEATFEETKSAILTTENKFTKKANDGTYEPIEKNIKILRNEKDDYSISNITGMLFDNKIYSGDISYRILYDCDKDWCKAYTNLILSSQYISSPVTTELFEYARLDDNTFAIQTSTERLLIKLADVEGDTDIRNRDIVEFYYSRLSGGQRTTFTPYEQLPEYNEEGKEIRDNTTKNKEINKYPLINEKGEPATIYGLNNSLFLLDKVSAIDYKWVFEDKALQQAIIFKNNTLVVTSYNKLTTKYERFIYSIDEIDPKLVKEIEGMVKIEGLVGVVAVKTTEIVPIVTTTATIETSAPITNIPDDVNSTSDTTTAIAIEDESNITTPTAVSADDIGIDDATTDVTSVANEESSTDMSEEPIVEETSVDTTSVVEESAIETDTTTIAGE